MEKKIIFQVIISPIVIFILLFVRCNSIESDWNSTQESDSVEKYQEFLNKYPNSKYSEQAKQFINLNLPSECQSAIDLMMAFWFNSIKPIEREGMVFFGTSSMMINTTAIKFNGSVKLDTTFFSQRILNRLNKYANVECSIEGEDIIYDYNGTQTIVNTQSVYSCKLDGKLKYDIRVVKGEFGIKKDNDFYIKDSTSIIINNKSYEFINERWKKK